MSQKERLLKPTELRPGVRTQSYEVLTEAIPDDLGGFSAKVRYRDRVETWRTWTNDEAQVTTIEEE